MARKTPSRLEMRRMAEAADAADSAKGTKKKKKATKRKTTRRAKVKAPLKKRLIWVVYNGGMKEEGKYPYAERKAAEEKLGQLQAKSPKRRFFIQAVKEEITDAPQVETEEE